MGVLEDIIEKRRVCLAQDYILKETRRNIITICGKQYYSSQVGVRITGRLRVIRAELEEYLEQLRYLAPNQFRKRVTLKRFSLNKKMAGSGFARNDKEVGDLIGKEDDYSFLFNPQGEIKEYIDEVLSQLTDRQRAVIDMRLYQGLTYNEIGKRLGVDHTAVLQSYYNNLETMKFWVRVRLAVNDCIKISGGFDWDRFLDEVDIFGVEEKEVLLTLLDSGPEDFETIRDFGYYIRAQSGRWNKEKLEKLYERKRVIHGVEKTELEKNSNLNAVCYTVRRVKAKLLLLGVPIEFIDAIHPIMEYYSPGKVSKQYCLFFKRDEVRNRNMRNKGGG